MQFSVFSSLIIYNIVVYGQSHTLHHIQSRMQWIICTLAGTHYELKCSPVAKRKTNP